MKVRLLFFSISVLIFSGIIHSQEVKFAEGQKIKSDSSDAIYLVFDQKLRKLDPNLLFSGLFKDFRNTAVIADSIFKTLHQGKIVKEAFLIRSYSNEIYLYIDQQKRHIESPQVMEAFGFNWNYVRRMTPNELDKIPSGDKITLDGSQIYPLPCGVRDKD